MSDRAMRIAIFGFYNALNAGDDRIQLAITHLLGGRAHQLYFLPHDLEPPASLLKEMDWVLIGGGGLVFAHHGIWYRMKKWMRKTRAKIGVLGLGINQLSAELKREIDDLIDRSDFFYVRDRRSRDLTQQHPKVSIAPDVTWFIPHGTPANLKVTEQFQYAVSLAPCHWKPFDPDEWIENLSLPECVPFPFYLTEKQDLGLLSRYFPEVPRQFSLLPLLASRTLIGARFHAIIFALQLGKPFVALSYDDKVREICREAGLEEYCLELDEANRLPSALRQLEEQRDVVIDKIRTFAEQQIRLASQTRQTIRETMTID